MMRAMAAPVFGLFLSLEPKMAFAAEGSPPVPVRQLVGKMLSGARADCHQALAVPGMAMGVERAQRTPLST